MTSKELHMGFYNQCKNQWHHIKYRQAIKNMRPPYILFYRISQPYVLPQHPLHCLFWQGKSSTDTHWFFGHKSETTRFTWATVDLMGKTITDFYTLKSHIREQAGSITATVTNGACHIFRETPPCKSHTMCMSYSNAWLYFSHFVFVFHVVGT